MQRVLALLLSLAFVTAAAASPAAACVSTTMATGGSEHECCGDQPLSTAPGGNCCVISQPVRDRALVEARTIGPTDCQADLAAACQTAWLLASDPGRQRHRAGPAVTHVYSVPIYLQQLSLLL